VSKPQIKRAVRIPVLRAIARGLRETFRHGPAYTVQAVAWALIAVAAYLPSLLPLDLDSVDSLAFYFYLAAPYLPFVVMLVGAAVILVSVYRAVVLDEVPSWRRAFRLGGRELRLFGFNLLFLAVGYLEMALLGIVVQLIGGPYGVDAELLFHSGAISQVGVAVTWNLFICITLIPFFGLAFPFVAIDSSSGLFRRSYFWSRGQRWRLAAIAVLTAVPVQIAAYAPYLIWEGRNDVVDHSLQIGIVAMVYLLGAAVRGGAFGSAFRIIADGQQGRTYDVFD